MRLLEFVLNTILSSELTSLLIPRPHFMDSLRYTTAVVKDVLRLFSLASASRQEKKNMNLTDDQGNMSATDGA
jgi:hypothetical protein